jgi:hypothetical protein
MTMKRILEVATHHHALLNHNISLIVGKHLCVGDVKVKLHSLTASTSRERACQYPLDMRLGR